MVKRQTIGNRISFFAFTENVRKTIHNRFEFRRRVNFRVEGVLHSVIELVAHFRKRGKDHTLNEIPREFARINKSRRFRRSVFVYPSGKFAVISRNSPALPAKQCVIVPHTVRAERKRHAVSYRLALFVRILMNVFGQHSVFDFHVFFARDGCRFKPVGKIVKHVVFKPCLFFQSTVQKYEIGGIAVFPVVLHAFVYRVGHVCNNVVFGMICFKRLNDVFPHIRAVTACEDLKGEIGFFAVPFTFGTARSAVSAV